MMLIGPHDSPFFRRIAIALALAERPFGHRPGPISWMPRRSAPPLVIDGDGSAASRLILTPLDDIAPAGLSLTPTGQAGGAAAGA